MLTNARVPVLGFVAASGTGKTTLLCKLIPLLRQAGLHVAAIKHTHHSFDMDQPGKDSFELRQAGAEQMLVASNRRWALMVENVSSAPEPALNELLAHIDQSRLDLILVEGFKHEAYPKIELHRAATGAPLWFPSDGDIIAIATDEPLEEATHLPQLNINKPEEVCRFIIEHFHLSNSQGAIDA
jgi:molybdopterin-guanine dinucleotide biosynthesis protein B